MVSPTKKRANARWAAKNPEKVAEMNKRNYERMKKEHPEAFENYRKNARDKNATDDTCEILTKHADDLADDPERLTTEFITGLIGTGEVEEE